MVVVELKYGATLGSAGWRNIWQNQLVPLLSAADIISRKSLENDVSKCRLCSKIYHGENCYFSVVAL